MAISPFNFGNRTDSSELKPESTDSDRLTLSQALTITAGLAGLVGLCSGAVVRFAISNSSNARFLSPLQTFPALSNWTPELPQNGADNRDLPEGTSSTSQGAVSQEFERRSWTEDDTYERSAQLESTEEPWVEKPWVEETELQQTIEEPANISTFDTFADRSEASTQETDSPWQRLEKGPSLNKTAISEEGKNEDADSYGELKDSGDGYVATPYSDEYLGESSSESNYYENAYDDPAEEYEAPYRNEPDSSYFDGQAGLSEEGF